MCMLARFCKWSVNCEAAVLADVLAGQNVLYRPDQTSRAAYTANEIFHVGM